MFIRLTSLKNDDKAIMITDPVIINLDKVTRFSKDTYYDTYEIEHEFVKVSFENGSSFPVKETLNEIEALINMHS